jgi:hypothetical protein
MTFRIFVHAIFSSRFWAYRDGHAPKKAVPSTIMSVKKLSVDVKADLQTWIAKYEARVASGEISDSTRLGVSAGGFRFRGLDQVLADYRRLLGETEFWRKADTEPQPLDLDLRLDDSGQDFHQYIFRNCAYKVLGQFTLEQEILLVQDYVDSERRKFERLQHKFRLAQRTDPRTERTGIPEEVRIAVWRRDGGRCVRCGTRERLEYDHIIPVSLGGSSTVRNIELLCETCNRSKGANVQ